MASDPRRSAIAGHVGMQPAPIVNITDGRGISQSYVMLGMLSMQFILLALVAWYLFTNQAMSAGVAGRADEAVVSRQEQIRGQAQSELLAEIIGGLDSNVGKKLLEKYERVKAEGAAAQSDLNAQRAIAEVSIREKERLARSIENLKRDLAEKETELATEKEKTEEYSASLAELTSAGRPIWKDWKIWAGGGVLCIFSVLIGFGAAIGLKKSDEEEDGSCDDRGDRLPPRVPQDRNTGQEADLPSSNKSGIEFEADEK